MLPIEVQKNFVGYLQRDPCYQWAKSLVGENSAGRVWLVGGYLFRNLARQLYPDCPQSKCDLDFITEAVTEDLTVPPSCEVSKNSFGSLRFRWGEMQVDLIPIVNIRPITNYHLPPTIESFLMAVPLTVQSLAYDLSSGEILGPVGWQAILDRTVGVNNEEEAAFCASWGRRRVKNIVCDKAQSLGFKPDLPVPK